MRTRASLDFESLSDARLHVLRYQPSDTTSIPSSSHTRFYCIWWHKPNRVGHRAKFSRYRWHWLVLLIFLTTVVCLFIVRISISFLSRQKPVFMFFCCFMMFLPTMRASFCFVLFCVFLLPHKAAYLNTEVSFKTSNNLLKRNNSSWLTFVPTPKTQWLFLHGSSDRHGHQEAL